MSNKPSFQRAAAFMIIGLGLIAIGFAAIALIPTTQTPVADGNTVQPIKVDYPAPSLTLTDVDGTPRSLSDYQGQVVLVNMWATWCPPCRREMPTLEAFYLEHKDQGFLIVGINDGDALELVTPFIAEYKLQFPIWIDPTYASETAFKTDNLPSSYVIDRQGQVRLEWVGEINRAMLDQYVVSIITTR